MKKMLLQKSELERILQLMTEFDCDYVTLRQDSGSGIGSVLEADFPVTVKQTPGEFRVEISGVENW